MWICKDCGSETFSEKVVVEKSEVVYNEEGELISYQEADESEWVTMCTECGSDTHDKSGGIELIANWID